MTGGYTIIPIVGRNNEKIIITATTASAAHEIKLGTFAKLKRAIALNKSCILTEVFFTGMKIVPGSVTYGTVALSGGGEGIVVVYYIPTANGGYAPRILHITSADNIYYTIS